MSIKKITLLIISICLVMLITSCSPQKYYRIYFYQDNELLISIGLIENKLITDEQIQKANQLVTGITEIGWSSQPDYYDPVDFTITNQNYKCYAWETRDYFQVFFEENPNYQFNLLDPNQGYYQDVLHFEVIKNNPTTDYFQLSVYANNQLITPYQLDYNSYFYQVSFIDQDIYITSQTTTLTTNETKASNVLNEIISCYSHDLSSYDNLIVKRSDQISLEWITLDPIMIIDPNTGDITINNLDSIGNHLIKIYLVITCDDYTLYHQFIYQITNQQVTPPSLTDLELINQELANLNLPQTIINSYPLPTTSFNQSVISYQSSNNQVIRTDQVTNTGWLYVNRDQFIDQYVDLTITIELNGFQVSKTISVLVPSGTTDAPTITIQLTDQLNGNQDIIIKVGELIDLPIPSYLGYQFIGWYHQDQKYYTTLGIINDYQLVAIYQKDQVTDLIVDFDDHELYAFDTINPVVEVVYNNGEYSFITTEFEITYQHANHLSGHDQYLTISYDGFSIDIYITVNKLSFNIDDIIFESMTITYDGSYHTIIPTNVPDGVEITTNYFRDASDYGYEVIAIITLSQELANNYYQPSNLEAYLYIEYAKSIVNPVYDDRNYYVSDQIPTLYLSENDTLGTISWNQNYQFEEGLNYLDWTFIPDDPNYTQVTGTIIIEAFVSLVISIEIYQYPFQMVYTEGDYFNSYGLIIKVNYEDGSYQLVDSNYGIIYPDDYDEYLTCQDVVFYVYYLGFTIELIITVNPKQ